MGFFSEALSSVKLPNDTKYQPIDNTDENEKTAQKKYPKKPSHLYYFAAGLSTALVFVILLFGVTHLLQPRSRTFQEIEDDEWNHCGRSSKIAMAKGCVMEPLFYGWMPSKCVFPELTEQFPVFEDRHWYSDANMTQLVTPKDLYGGKHKLIWTQRYHDEHCLFQWRKLQYGMHHGKEFLDNKTISIHHSKHCSDQLSKNCEPPNTTVGYLGNIVELGFYRCRKTVFLSQ